MGSVQKRTKLVDDVHRLRELDGALRGDGVNVPDVAERWQTTTRAVHRYLDVLRELVSPTEAARADDGHFRQKYAGRPARLFAK
jgi:predicted ArsR family transcriptional regulator